MKIPTFEGVMTVVATPFDQSGSIAFDVLGKHIDFLIGHGVHYIIPGGTTGEYYSQTLEERKQVLAYAAERVGKRVKLGAGTNSARPADTIELSNYAKGLGYDALMLAASRVGSVYVTESSRKRVKLASSMRPDVYAVPPNACASSSAEYSSSAGK